ncbi:hypothetical protein [Vreelandella sulfidaeris]
MNRKTISVNVNFDADTHRKLRLLVSKSGLTNSEVVNALVEQLEFQTAQEMLNSTVEKKKAAKLERRKLKKQVEALDPEDVKRILSLLKKEDNR